MSRRIRLGLVAVAILAGAAASAPAVANASDGAQAAESHCAKQFEQAQRVDMESFRDYDLATWRAAHDPSAVTVFGSGAYRIGIDAIVAALQSHFDNRNAIWSWTEVTRNVQGCKSAVIVYQATYEIPGVFFQRGVVSVAYTYKQGQWLSIFDQTTVLPTS